MTTEKLEKICSLGIDCNTLAILQVCKEGEVVSKVAKINGWLNLAKRKDLINEDNKITDLGYKILEELKEIAAVAQTNGFEMWTVDLLAKLKGKLKEVTGRDQVMGFGKVYFIPQIQDLRTFLKRFNRDYKISLQDNKERIEKILLKHVESCAKSGSYAPAVKYFIIKEKTGSQLATALDSIEDEEVEEKQFNLVKTKDLFN